MTEKEEREEEQEKRYDEGHRAGYELAETRKELKAVRELLPVYEKAVEDLYGLLQVVNDRVINDLGDDYSELAQALRNSISTFSQMRDTLRELL